MLYYTKDTLNEKARNEFVNNFSFIEKSKRLFKLLNVVEWLEEELGVNRFRIVDLEIDDVDKLIEKMLKEIDMFQWVNHKTAENIRKEEISDRIKKLTSEDKIKKFFIDIINQFDNFYS